MVDEKQSVNVTYKIRPCAAEDEAGALAVCLRTGDGGNDASSQFKDPNVLGYRYVSPYIHFSPELAFVLVDSEEHVCGYVLATLQSDVFYQRYIDEWLPKMRKLYPIIPTDRSTNDWQMIQNFHQDTYQSCRLFDGYPSHLHIDLLPKAQGQGYGTKMIQHIENELKRHGSIGVHLEMAANNHKAFRFYTKLGFTVLAADTHALWLGKKLA